jgi:type II secretory pathway pseudopilin PulG
MDRVPIRHRPQPSEEGYVLLAVMFMLVILIISMSIAMPKIAKEIQRDRELETMHRGKQYARAIKLYYKKFNAYPPNVDALIKTSEIRYLRKKYVDPTTGKDEWHPIHFGEAKTQTLGFFGQPIAGSGSAGGSVLAGTGPSGGNGIAGASSIGGIGSSGGFGSSGGLGSSSTFGSSAGGASSFGSNPSGSSASGATGTAATDGSGGSTAGSASTDTSGGAASGGTSSGSGSGSSGIGSSPTGTGSSGSSAFGGQTFGGGGIIGFSPNSPKQSILVYKKKNHYNEWEFIYDPLADMMTLGSSSGPGGQSAAGMSNGVGGSSNTGGSGTSFGSGSNSFGNSNSSPGGTNSPGGTGSTPQPSPQQ